MSVEQIENQIVSVLSSLTEEEIDKKLKWCATKSYHWMNKARQQIERSRVLQRSLHRGAQRGKRTLAELEMETFTFQYKLEKVDIENLNNKKILIDGYKILSDINEWLYGTPLKYSITVTSSGENLVSANVHNIHTFEIPLSKFINALHSGQGKLRIRNSKTLYKELLASYNASQDKKNKLAYQAWNKGKQGQLIYLNRQVRIRNWPWQNVGEGQVLDTFLKLTNNGADISAIHFAKDHAYWRKLYHTMQDSQDASNKLLLNDDLENLIIKGLVDSVTDITTLINTFSELLNIFANYTNTRTVLEKHMKVAGVQAGIKKNFENTQSEVVNNLLKMFHSKTYSIKFDIT